MKIYQKVCFRITFHKYQKYPEAFTFKRMEESEFLYFKNITIRHENLKLGIFT